MSSDYRATRDIYLVFMNTSHGFDFILKDGFHHVYCIERQALGWVCTDPSKSDLYNYILPAQYEADVMTEFVKRNPTFTILHLIIKPHDKSIYAMPCMMSCVGVMQYLIGVYWPFVFTPYQLYNKIKNKPPKHIEVIECHDIQSMQPKGKQQQPQQPQTPPD